jgi:hypothetical protein
MANLGNVFGGGFDASQVEPSAPIELLPPGNYVAQIVQSEMRQTKGGTGQLLWLEMEILEGPAKGRKLWDQLNLVNPNAQTVEIAQRTLSAICHATGRLQVSDSEQLHFTPMMVTVKVRPAGPDKQGIRREASNRIGGYKPAGGATPGPAPMQHRPAAAPAAGPAPRQQPMANAPWRRAG